MRRTGPGRTPASRSAWRIRHRRARSRPQPQHDAGEHVVLGDGAAGPRVDALGGVVARHPPAVAVAVVRPASPPRRRRRTAPAPARPGRGSAPYRTSSRSPASSVGSIERPRTTATPNLRATSRGRRGSTGPPREPRADVVPVGVVSQASDALEPQRRRPRPHHLREEHTDVHAVCSPPPIEVSAHCDLPCGVYDPAQARIEAESIKAIIAKVADNDDPDFRTRAILIKEQRSELVKHHLWVLWTDYFKPPHFEKYPQLHTLVNEATKLAGAGGTKGSWTPRRPTSCSPRSTRSPRSSGRPRRPERVKAFVGLQPWSSPRPDVPGGGSSASASGDVGNAPAAGRPGLGWGRSEFPHSRGCVVSNRPDVELRLPAESAYVAVLRMTTAGLAARLDFTLDDIEDLRMAVSEACALVLDDADPGGRPARHLRPRRRLHPCLDRRRRRRPGGPRHRAASAGRS